MRYLPTSKLMPGMALGQDIYDGAGRLLLAKHLLLSEEYISHLEFLGFPGVYIDDEFTRGIEIQEVISPQIRSQALKMVHELFTFALDGEEPSVEEIRIVKTIESVVEYIVRSGDVMCNMIDIKNYDDYIYYHSIQVGLLSIMIGVRYGLEQEDLCQLATAAFLHDIGKCFIDPDIVNETWPLQGQDREVFKSHPKLGAEFVRGTYRFSPKVYVGILEHHEWYNGQGYPLNKAKDEIHLFARIIKLADSYDALTSQRPGRTVQAPSDAMEFVMAMAGVEFDPNLVNILMHKAAMYPVGCEVELSNGVHAVVAKNFEDFPLRPLVKVLETGDMINLRDDVEARRITVGRIIL